MENRSKGIAWFGDVYRKFETMCLEVEEVNWQGGFRYMEDHVQTVGENVKQFCTEFVREVLPESLKLGNAVSDTSVSQTDGGVNQIPVTSMDRDPLENQTCEETVSTEASPTELVMHAQDALPLEGRMASLMHDKFEMSSVENDSEEKQLNSEVSDIFAEEDNDPVTAYPALDDGERIPDVPSSSSAVLDERFKHRFLDIKPPNDSASTGLTGNTDAEMDAEDMSVDSMTLAGLNREEQLDGSCILVDSFELAKPSTKGRPRSFKKKLGSALLIRRRSSKRSCSEPDSKLSKVVCKTVSSPSSSSSIITIQCEESSDSDWEII